MQLVTYSIAIKVHTDPPALPGSILVQLEGKVNLLYSGVAKDYFIYWSFFKIRILKTEKLNHN